MRYLVATERLGWPPPRRGLGRFLPWETQTPATVRLRTGTTDGHLSSADDERLARALRLSMGSAH